MVARSASGSGSMKVASGTSRWALPSGIPRRTPSARASGLASTTGPGSHGRPPRMSGPVGKGSQARARASSSGRWGRWRWSSRIVVGPFVGRGGWIGGLVDEEVVAAETGVALTSFRVQDPEGRVPPRRAVAVAGDERLRPLADDVASEPDPRSAGELETEAGRLGDGGRQAAGQARWLEHDHERLRPTGEGRQTAEPVRDPGGLVRGGQPATGQVEDEQVHRAAGQQRARDGQALVEGLRGDDHEPFEPDAPGDRLDRVEAARQVQPGHDRAGRLGLRREPEDQRGPSARAVAADRDAGRARQAAGTEDRVERREPGVDDPIVGGRGRLGSMRRDRGGCRGGREGEGPVRDRGGRVGRAVPAALGAAAPQRACRLATAAVTSGERVAIGRLD